MKPDRRSNAETTRDAILDATETIMVEEGYAAVSARRVAERAGLKSLLVHYHFGSMEELFVAVYERLERDYLPRHLEALSSKQPLRALWDLSIHPKRTRLSQELIALSNHKVSIRKITARVITQIHAANAIFIAKYFGEAGIDCEKYPPIVISHVINGLSRTLVSEDTLGLSEGRAEVLAFAERLLSDLDMRYRTAQPHKTPAVASG